MARPLLLRCLVSCFAFMVCGGAAVAATADSIDGVTAGFGHGCARTSSGGVQCWGKNDRGQPGDGTTIDRTAPTPVVGFDSGAIGIAAGSSHTCALTDVGGVRCWGSNSRGQLADGTTTDSPVSVAVSGLGSGIVAIAARSDHTCALATGGGVWCWGANYAGQLGDGTTTDSLVPVAVSGLGTDIVAIAPGGSHTCVLASGGGVWCWEQNNRGQLGDGTTTDSIVPVTVSGLASSVSAVATGGEHTCAVLVDGVVLSSCARMAPAYDATRERFKTALHTLLRAARGRRERRGLRHAPARLVEVHGPHALEANAWPAHHSVHATQGRCFVRRGRDLEFE